MPSILETMDMMKKSRKGRPQGAGTRDPMSTSSTASRLSTSFPTVSSPTGPSSPKPQVGAPPKGGEPFTGPNAFSGVRPSEGRLKPTDAETGTGGGSTKPVGDGSGVGKAINTATGGAGGAGAKDAPDAGTKGTAGSYDTGPDTETAEGTTIEDPIPEPEEEPRGGPDAYEPLQWSENAPLWAGVPPGQAELYEEFGAQEGQVNFMQRKQEYLKKLAWALENRPDLVPALEDRLKNIEDNIRRQMENNGWKPGGEDDGSNTGNATGGGSGGGGMRSGKDPLGGLEEEEQIPGLTQEVIQDMVDGLYDFQNNDTHELVTEEMSTAYREALVRLAQSYGFDPTKPDTYRTQERFIRPASAGGSQHAPANRPQHPSAANPPPSTGGGH